MKDWAHLKLSRKAWFRKWRVLSKRVRGFAIWRNKGGGMSKLSRFDKRREGSMSKSIPKTHPSPSGSQDAGVDPHRNHDHGDDDANANDNSAHFLNVTLTVPPSHPAHEVHHDVPLQQRQQEQQERPTKEPLSPASGTPDDHDAASLAPALSKFGGLAVQRQCSPSTSPPERIPLPWRTLVSPAPTLLQGGGQTRSHHGGEVMTQAQRGREETTTAASAPPHY
ncbi:hypothetical protein BKA70DRAFT_86941 [Coprinopsis sp. MPI-PUGE-AT-0042]|nr:hypothetical protein BKA70DRAFT_86941 [Coprinopsis sp. MPI-PUGE-AT-0042]